MVVKVMEAVVMEAEVMEAEVMEAVVMEAVMMEEEEIVPLAGPIKGLKIRPESLFRVRSRDG